MKYGRITNNQIIICLYRQNTVKPSYSRYPLEQTPLSNGHFSQEWMK